MQNKLLPTKSKNTHQPQNTRNVRHIKSDIMVEIETIMSDFILTYLPKHYTGEEYTNSTLLPGKNDRAEMLKWKKNLYRMRGLNILKNKENS